MLLVHLHYILLSRCQLAYLFLLDSSAGLLLEVLYKINVELLDVFELNLGLRYRNGV